MRVLFLIQGEGRGHLTQALALAPLLREAGHDVSAALVGTSPEKRLPSFFLREIGAPVERFAEPAFGYSAQGVAWAQTVAENARRLPALAKTFRVLEAAMNRYAPDVVVNFFTLAGGLYGRLRGYGVPVVCVGHQYMFHHGAYPFPPGERVARRVAQSWTALTVPPGARRLALSFYEADDVPDLNLRVAPPLLRTTLRTLAPGNHGHVLSYLLHAAQAPAFERWAASNPDRHVHLFRDAPDEPSVVRRGNVTFHGLDGDRFLALMAQCRGLVCTAGFESVCEALYLGKPALMVPVQGHFEQTCNARDAEHFGAGIFRRSFDLDALDLIAEGYQAVDGFRSWADSAASVFVQEIEQALKRGGSRHSRRHPLARLSHPNRCSAKTLAEPV